MEMEWSREMSWLTFWNALSILRLRMSKKFKSRLRAARCQKSFHRSKIFKRIRKISQKLKVVLKSLLLHQFKRLRRERLNHYWIGDKKIIQRKRSKINFQNNRWMLIKRRLNNQQCIKHNRCFSLYKQRLLKKRNKNHLDITPHFLKIWQVSKLISHKRSLKNLKLPHSHSMASYHQLQKRLFSILLNRQTQNHLSLWQVCLAKLLHSDLKLKLHKGKDLDQVQDLANHLKTTNHYSETKMMKINKKQMVLCLDLAKNNRRLQNNHLSQTLTIHKKQKKSIPTTPFPQTLQKTCVSVLVEPQLTVENAINTANMRVKRAKIIFICRRSI